MPGYQTPEEQDRIRELAEYVERKTADENAPFSEKIKELEAQATGILMERLANVRAESRLAGKREAWAAMRYYCVDRDDTVNVCEADPEAPVVCSFCLCPLLKEDR